MGSLIAGIRTTALRNLLLFCNMRQPNVLKFHKFRKMKIENENICLNLARENMRKHKIIGNFTKTWHFNHPALLCFKTQRPKIY